VSDFNSHKHYPDGGLLLSPISSSILPRSRRSLHPSHKCHSPAKTHNRRIDCPGSTGRSRAGGSQFFIHKCPSCPSLPASLVINLITPPFCGTDNQSSASPDGNLPSHPCAIAKLSSHKNCALRSTLGSQSYQQRYLAHLLYLSPLSYLDLDQRSHPAIWCIRGLDSPVCRQNRRTRHI
jgi:hypothetical protein